MPSPNVFVLPKTVRLKREDFARIRRQATSIRGEHFLLRVLCTREPQPARAGIIIAKKSIALSTARNRVRRRIRMALQSLLPPAPAGTSVLVLVRGGVVNLPFQAIKTELSMLFRRARLLR